MALIQPIELQPLNVKIVVSLKLNLVGKIYINEKYSKKYWDKKIFNEIINSDDYDDKFIRGKIFQEYIDEILETPCDDKSGYYNPNSREILTKVNIKELYDVKYLIKSELNTVIMIDRYNAIYTFCRLYEEWCLKKKSEQIEDVTKKERFDVTKDLPIKISTQR